MLYVLMFAHWLGDFVFQSSWMALNKGSCWKALLAHVAVYSVVIALFAALVTATWQGLAMFALANFALHLAVDAVTSRITNRFWPRDNKRNFFITVGFDQFLHFASLAWTCQYFLC